jgi:phosphoglycolate phosphatase
MSAISLETKTILWDLDGTILDSVKITEDVFASVLPRHGRAVPERQHLVNSFHGSLDDMIRRVIGTHTDDEFDRIRTDFVELDITSMEYADEHLFPDAVRLAQRMAAAGLYQAVVTDRNHNGKSGKTSPRTIVGNSRLNGLINEVICGDEVAVRKPSARVVEDLASRGLLVPERTVVIGDQPTDAGLAGNIGAAAILIARTPEERTHLDQYPFAEYAHVDIVSSLDLVGVGTGMPLNA